MYFNSIPKIFYDSEDTKNPKIVTNLLRRVGVRAKVKVNTALFDTYKVKEGETPEIIAHKLYGDTELHWVIMLVNNVLDRYHDWPMSTPQFNQYIADKYVDSDGESTASDVHHYEIEQDSGSDKIKIEVPLVIRLAGTNVEKGNQILKESKINYIEANTLEDAANKAVAALKK